MTKEEAIKILRHWGSNTPAIDRDCAVKMAIEALENPKPHWIPCSEGLPEREGYFLVTVSCMGVICVDARFYYVERDSRHWGNYESGSVIAWMTLPAPYQPQKEVTECQIGLRGH